MGSNLSNVFPTLPNDQTSLILTNRMLDQVPYIIKNSNQLQILNLTNNRITELPKHLEKLNVLILAGNNLDEVPEKIEKRILEMKELITLDFSHNNIGEFPESLSKLKTLKNLRLFLNSLSEINLEMDQLEVLDLSQNRFEVLPKLPSGLTGASFDYNLLKVIDVTLENLSALRFSMNRIEKFESTCRFAKLKSLDLSMNKLETLPDLSVVTPQLEKLDFSYNKISKIPKLPSTIKEIRGFNNCLTSIPKKFSKLKLKVLDVSFNKISALPSLPSTLLALTIDNNKITTIAESELPYLSSIIANNNKFDAFMPFKAKNIKEYYLSRNRIKTIDPSFISNSITKLNLPSNKLKSIPGFIFELPNLIVLNLGNNKLSTLPREVESSHLQLINISENLFETLDFSLPQSLLVFNCSMCKLTSLGDALKNCGTLIELSCFNNKITKLPKYLKTLSVLRASMNGFKKFPKIGPLINNIDLSCNQIKSLPSFDDYKELVDLDLSYNKIKSLPDISKCTGLKTLKLANNPLSAKIDLSCFPELETLDISNTEVKFNSEIKHIREIITNNDIFKNSNVYKVFKGDKNICYSEKRGIRDTMEDAIIIQKNVFDGCDIYGVFDGHGGSKTADFCSHELPKLFTEADGTLTDSFIKTQFKTLIESARKKNYTDGTTASIVFIHNNEIISANLGDSRSLVIKDDGSVKFSTKDHKPNDREEIDRVLKIGGRVFSNRIDGILAVSRAIGDFDIYGVGYKPKIERVKIDNDDKWIILGCDGVFDVITNKELGKYTTKFEDPVSLAYSLSNLAFTRLSADNISVIVIKLHE